MTLNELMETVPAYARDLKLNFSSLTQQTELNKQQIWGTVVASAVVTPMSVLAPWFLTTLFPLTSRSRDQVL